MSKRKKILLWMLFIILLAFALIYGSYRLHQPTAMRIRHLPPGDDVHVALRLIPEDTKIVRVLSLSGGGVRGILTLHVLQYLEKVTGKPISKLFDFVVCTSTGCLIAAQLLTPDAHGHPKFTAEEALKNYIVQAKSIFHNPLSHRIITLWGFLGPEYSNRRKGRVLREDVGRSVLVSQLLLPTVITTYSLTDRAPRLFLSYDEEARHYYLWTVLNSATSAPVFFPATVLHAIDDELPEDTLIDGGVYAHDPSLIALSHAFFHYPDASYLVVSIGTGHYVPAIEAREARRWGILGWWHQLMLMIFNAQAVDANRVLSHIDDSDVLGRRLDYYYFNIPIPIESEHTDDVAEVNIKRLNDYGERLVRKHRAQLDQLANRLSALSK